jgi:poly(A) polymerase
LLQNDQTFPALKFLETNQFETALAVLLRPLFQNELQEIRKRVEQVDAVCRRLRLSNDETGCICWLLSSLPTMNDIAKQPLHVLKPLLANPSANLLLELSAAIAMSENRPPVDAAFCRCYLSTVSFDVLSPATLIDGRDVMQLGIAAGPVVRDLLAIVRNEQLDEQLANREQAIIRLKQLVGHINLA